MLPEDYNPNNYDYQQIYVYNVLGDKVVKGTGYSDLGKSLVEQPKGHSHATTGHHHHTIVGGSLSHPEDAIGTTGLGDVIPGAGSSGSVALAAGYAAVNGIPGHPLVQPYAYTPGHAY